MALTPEQHTRFLEAIKKQQANTTSPASNIAPATPTLSPEIVAQVKKNIQDRKTTLPTPKQDNGLLQNIGESFNKNINIAERNAQQALKPNTGFGKTTLDLGQTLGGVLGATLSPVTGAINTILPKAISGGVSLAKEGFKKSPVGITANTLFKNLPEKNKKQLVDLGLELKKKGGNAVNDIVSSSLATLQEQRKKHPSLDKAIKDKEFRDSFDTVMNILDLIGAKEFTTGAKALPSIIKATTETLGKQSEKLLPKAVVNTVKNLANESKAIKIAKSTEKYKTILRKSLPYKKGSFLKRNDAFVEKHGKDIINTATDLGVTFSTSPEGVFRLGDEIARLRNSAVDNLKPTTDELSSLFKGVTLKPVLKEVTDETGKKIVRPISIREDAFNFLTQKQNLLKNDANKALDTLLKRISGDAQGVVDLPKAIDLKSRIQSIAFNKEKATSNLEKAARAYQNSLRKRIIDTAKKVDKSGGNLLESLYKEQETIFSLAKELEKLNNTKANKRLLNKTFVRLGGTIAGAGAGFSPFGSLLTGEGAALINSIVGDLTRLSEKQVARLTKLGALPSYINTVDEAKKYISAIKELRAKNLFNSRISRVLKLKQPKKVEKVIIAPKNFRPDQSGAFKRAVPRRAQPLVPNRRITAGPEGGVIIPPFTPPTVIEPRAKKIDLRITKRGRRLVLPKPKRIPKKKRTLPKK